MSQGWKITVIVLAAIGVVSTPLIWLLESPGAGQLAGAATQSTVGIAALFWALFQHPENGPGRLAAGQRRILPQHPQSPNPQPAARRDRLCRGQLNC
ncbi:hypothetical protein AB0L26_03225 [Streptomyces nondiastaticus]|uniref:hypothetical protein n=1 Tax=Streptomyces nondiastaticus TaxID=3154512 RepID=UPI00344245BE